MTTCCRTAHPTRSLGGVGGRCRSALRISCRLRGLPVSWGPAQPSNSHHPYQQSTTRTSTPGHHPRLPNPRRRGDPPRSDLPRPEPHPPPPRAARNIPPGSGSGVDEVPVGGCGRPGRSASPSVHVTGAGVYRPLGDRPIRRRGGSLADNPTVVNLVDCHMIRHRQTIMPTLRPSRPHHGRASARSRSQHAVSRPTRPHQTCPQHAKMPRRGLRDHP